MGKRMEYRKGEGLIRENPVAIYGRAKRRKNDGGGCKSSIIGLF